MPVLSPRWIARVDPAGWASRLKSVPWLKLRAGVLCAEDRLDAYWASATFVPSLSPSIRVVTTVYDLAHLVVPETMKTVTYWAFRLFFARDVRRANVVLSISQGTSDRLFQMLGRRSDGVVLPAVSPTFRPQSSEVVAATLTRLGVKPPYFLAVGTLEPRKNLELLINVFAGLKSEGQLGSQQLVLVGGRGWKDLNLQRLLKQHSGSDVIPLGYVAEQDLPALYAGADAFVFPSRYEGFGIPALEARACGARIVASDIPEIKEAGGIGPLYIPPTPEALADALLKIREHAPSATDSNQALPDWDAGARVLSQALTGKKE
jgi:glycosyltransferase involved in cell wall biosynthesis